MFEPIEIKTNDIEKSVTPKKKVDLIILVLIAHNIADKIEIMEKIIIKKLITFFPCLF
tara:strand:+ start:1871 stop:2044 length:174 start_codon:yes stop_codon:yes gene_type:complete